MRTRIAALALAILCSAPAAWGQRVVLADRIVAVVNSDVVTLSELNARIELAIRSLERQGTPPPDRKVLEPQVLDRLILHKAQIQLARENGIRVEEVQLDRTVQRIAENNSMTLAEFRGVLEKDGVSFAKFRDEVREEITLTRLREREVDDRIQVSESEIDLYLEESKSAGAAEAAEYNIAHVLVRIPEQATPERISQLRARAETVRTDAGAGADFARLAAGFSDAPDGLQGGSMGWRAHDRLPELFADALKQMRPGQVSEVLRSPAGFHVLKLLERRGAGGTSDSAQVMQTRARHILVRQSEVVSEADARRRLSDLRERIIKGGESFPDLARLHSEDGSAARGGDLDWVYPGDTVPDFERALDALKPGELSQPVRTPFGMHLILVLERRLADMSAERRRLQARVALRERKSDEAYQEWLRLLRDRTYVEMRLEDK